jgi:hypothetical protein
VGHPPKPDLKDAHDFAIAQFRSVSDLVIDAAAPDANLLAHKFLISSLDN